jgi:hypothetical protein
MINFNFHPRSRKPGHISSGGSAKGEKLDEKELQQKVKPKPTLASTAALPINC